MLLALVFAVVQAAATGQSTTATVTAGDTVHRAAGAATTVTISTTTADTGRVAAAHVDTGAVLTPGAIVPTVPAVTLPTSLIAPSPLPAWLVYLVVGSLVALVFFFAHGMWRTHTAREAPHRALAFAAWIVHPFTGNDGRLSFSKLVCCGVLVHYAISANLPAVVACWIIAASFGTKVLLAVVEKTGLSISSSTALSGAFSRTEADAETRTDSRSDSRSTSDQTVRTVNEQITRTILDERGPTGEAPRSLPAVNAATPDGAR